MRWKNWTSHEISAMTRSAMGTTESNRKKAVNIVLKAAEFADSTILESYLKKAASSIKGVFDPRVTRGQDTSSTTGIFLSNSRTFLHILQYNPKKQTSIIFRIRFDASTERMRREVSQLNIGDLVAVVYDRTRNLTKLSVTISPLLDSPIIIEQPATKQNDRTPPMKEINRTEKSANGPYRSSKDRRIAKQKLKQNRKKSRKTTKSGTDR